MTRIEALQSALCLSAVPTIAHCIGGRLFLVSIEIEGETWRSYVSEVDAELVDQGAAGHAIGKHTEKALRCWRFGIGVFGPGPAVAKGYPDDDGPIRSEHPEPAIRAMADAGLAYLAEASTPYTYNVFSADEVGVDGYLDLEALAAAMLKGLRI